MTSLRVLHVVPHLDRVGGYERQALALARVQNRRPDTTPILLTHAAAGRPATETTDAGQIVRLPKGLRRHHPSSWWHAHGGGVDVVHCHAMHKLSGQVVALAHEAGVPSMVKVATGGDVQMFAEPGSWGHVLDGDERSPGGLRWRRMMRTAFQRLRRADLFLALNAEIEAELARRRLPVQRVDNGVDTGHFRPARLGERARARQALGLPGSAFVMVTVGRLATRKGLDVLLDGFTSLHSQVPDAHWLLVGDGPRRDDLQARAVHLGLASAIHITGQLDDTRQVFHAADVVCHASHREGQPNAVLEGLACGLPVVASDIAGHRDLRGEALRLVDPDSSQAYTQALVELHAEPSRRTARAEAARDLAEGRFDMRHAAARYRKLYHQLLLNRPSAHARAQAARDVEQP